MTDNQVKFENKIGRIFLVIFMAFILMLMVFLIGINIGFCNGEKIGIVEGYSSGQLTSIPGGATLSYTNKSTGQTMSFFLTQKEEEYINKVKKDK